MTTNCTSWPKWAALGAALVLIVYPLSLGPVHWLVIRLPHQSWFPLDLETLYSWCEVYSRPAFYLGGVPQNRLGLWLQDYVEWWRNWALEPFMARSDRQATISS